MADITIAVRFLNSAGGLVYAPPASVQVVVAARGAVTQRTQRATGAYVKGAALISTVADLSSYTLVLRVVAAGKAAAQAVVNSITAAATQSEWRLEITMDDDVQTYLCDAADWSAPTESPELWSNRRTVTLTIPVQPDPL